jgi:hypothetical protein
MPKKTTITIETSSSVVIRAEGPMSRSCSACGSTAQMISVEDFEVLGSLHRSPIERLLGSRELHRSEGLFGSLAIYLNSLLANLTGGKSAECGLARANKETK